EHHRRQRRTVRHGAPRDTRAACSVLAVLVHVVPPSPPQTRPALDRLSWGRVAIYGRAVHYDGGIAMSVVISHHATKEVVARYEVHLVRGDETPEDEQYFDDAWRKAVADGFVDPDERSAYDFQLQRPKTLYEASQ